MGDRFEANFMKYNLIIDLFIARLNKKMFIYKHMVYT